MIQYSNRTLGDVYQEVVIRLGTLRTGENLDYRTIVNLINYSVKEIVSKYLPFKEWTNRYNTYISDQSLVPLNLIKPIRVLLSVSGLAPYNEARRVDVRELYNLMSWEKRNSWNRASVLNPVYAFWGFPDPGNLTPSRKILLAPNVRYQIGVSPPYFEYDTQNVSGYMEYYGMPYALSDVGDRIQLPYEFEDMVVPLTLSRVYYKLGLIDMMTNIYTTIAAQVGKIRQRYEERTVVPAMDSVSYLEPTIPNIPPADAPGEVPNNLITGRKR